ncbi:hypothetical protein SAMN02910298_00261 [Pseudobutyrivibrio sp. YE44]|uniref:hypothetical protein n=1 Tax=Pseudobutyrivibrio sp. YE44 TaxID=1520802 RepID=UPI0008817CE8|nr:hypothetical protein [Pseudobutyrivibrio sp. YE44]SDB07674.1 hypothetical protein SAMN02910298_00261 [Pseudobutyrivibrio sp. YE44]
MKDDTSTNLQKSNSRMLKFMVIVTVVIIAILSLDKAINQYSGHKAKQAEAARQEFAKSVETMDLSPYSKSCYKSLSVTKTDFTGGGGLKSNNSLFQTNYITLEGEGVGTEQLSHEQVYNYMHSTLEAMYADIDSMCENSPYVQHIKNGDAIYRGERIYNYRNYISFTLRDTKNEYQILLFYPPEDSMDKNFYVRANSNTEHASEEWNNSKFNGSSSGSSSKGRSGGTYKKKDIYDSSRYKDADSFAEDYYEEFYDYDDYEDDDDAYDGAVDYWEEWNE